MTDAEKIKEACKAIEAFAAAVRPFTDDIAEDDSDG